MYCVQNKTFCGVCNKFSLADKYPNQLKSQGHINEILKNHCTISLIVKTHFINK